MHLHEKFATDLSVDKEELVKFLDFWISSGIVAILQCTVDWQRSNMDNKQVKRRALQRCKITAGEAQFVLGRGWRPLTARVDLPTLVMKLCFG